MKKKVFFILALVSYFFSCTDKKTTIETPKIPITDTTSISFFPVTAFLKGQIRQFDSLTVTPLIIITKNQKDDSVWLKKEQLTGLLQPFFSSEINETNLIKYFKENKFNDQTLNAITLTYDPIATTPDSINILSWNVYVNPKTGNVDKIYMVKHINENGQNITQQLTWHSNKYAEINEILDKPNSDPEIVKQQKIIWNFTP